MANFDEVFCTLQRIIEAQTHYIIECRTTLHEALRQAAFANAHTSDTFRPWVWTKLLALEQGLSDELRVDVAHAVAGGVIRDPALTLETVELLPQVSAALDLKVVAVDFTSGAVHAFQSGAPFVPHPTMVDYLVLIRDGGSWCACVRMPSAL